MAGINKVIIVGRLGADPEMKTVGPNSTVTRLSLATSENWTDKNGQKQERTEWHRVVAWGKLAEICGKYLAKGRQVYIEGRLQTRSWDDATSGQKKYSTEIIATSVEFLGSNNENRPTQQQDNTSSAFQDFGPEPQFDAAEELPF